MRPAQSLGAVASQAPSPHAPSEGAEAAELCPGYNWSLAWSLSASGLTVWPGEGAWGGWDTGGRPWDRDIALGTMPSTAVGMPLGATPTTPGGYLLGGGWHVKLAVGEGALTQVPLAVSAPVSGASRPERPSCSGLLRPDLPVPWGPQQHARPGLGAPTGPCPGHTHHRSVPCPHPHSPVGSPIELGVHDSGVHAGPVGGRCQVILVDAVFQAVGDPAWETQQRGRAVPCAAAAARSPQLRPLPSGPAEAHPDMVTTQPREPPALSGALSSPLGPHTCGLRNSRGQQRPSPGSQAQPDFLNAG